MLPLAPGFERIERGCLSACTLEAGERKRTAAGQGSFSLRRSSGAGRGLDVCRPDAV